MSRIDEAGRLVAYVYQALLYVFEGRHFSVRVALKVKPGGEGLERTVGTAPSVIVHFVLAIVVVVALASYYRYFSA